MRGIYGRKKEELLKTLVDVLAYGFLTFIFTPCVWKEINKIVYFFVLNAVVLLVITFKRGLEIQTAETDRPKICRLDKMVKKAYSESSLFKIVVAFGFYGLLAYTCIPSVGEKISFFFVLEDFVKNLSFEFGALANDVIASQLTLSFLIITVLSVLSENSVLVLWENRIEVALIRPFLGSFLDFTVYSFGTIFSSVVAYINKDINGLLYYFLLNIVFLTVLTFKMILVYYGREERIAALDREYDKMLKEVQKAEDEVQKVKTTKEKLEIAQEKLKIAREKKENVRKILFVNTMKAIDDKDLKVANENLDYYGKIIEEKNETLTEEEYEFFNSEKNEFTKLLSEEKIKIKLCNRWLKELKKDYSESSSDWFKEPTVSYREIDKMYHKASSAFKKKMKEMLADYPWFEWNMTPEFAERTSVALLWVMGEEPERKVDEYQDILHKWFPEINQEDFYHACRKGYWSEIEDIILGEFELDYFYKAIVDGIVDDERTICAFPHNAKKKITFADAFFGEKIKNNGEFRRVVRIEGDNRTPLSVCQEFENYMKENLEKFSEKQRNEYVGRLEKLKEIVNSKLADIVNGIDDKTELEDYVKKLKEKAKNPEDYVKNSEGDAKKIKANAKKLRRRLRWMALDDWIKEMEKILEKEDGK